MQETTEYHRRYLRAINNPMRRAILRCLQGGCQTISALTAITGLDAPTVRWHLDVLEYGFCVES
jgi:DNA-binding transcriptional ArsR family regulator